MAKYEPKTKPTSQTAAAHIKTLSKDEQKIAKELVKIFKEVTKAKPVMWSNIVGFGSYNYLTKSGCGGDFLATGFAMRKSGPVLYIMPGYQDYSVILRNLGPHKLGKSCLYLKNLHEIHIPTLKKLIRAGLKDLRKTHTVTLK